MNILEQMGTGIFFSDKSGYENSNQINTSADLGSVDYLDADTLVSAGRWLTFIEKKTGRILSQKDTSSCPVHSVGITKSRILGATTHQLCEYTRNGDYVRTIPWTNINLDSSLSGIEFDNGSVGVVLRNKDNLKVYDLKFVDANGNTTYVRHSGEQGPTYVEDIVQLDGNRALVVGGALVRLIDSSGLITKELSLPGSFAESSAIKLNERYVAIVSQDESYISSKAIKVNVRLLDSQSMTISDVVKGQYTFNALPDPYEIGHPIKRRTSYIAKFAGADRLILALGDAILHSYTTYVKVERSTTVKSFTLVP